MVRAKDTHNRADEPEEVLPTDFWSSLTVADYALRQGVSVLSANALLRAAFWPEDLDPIDFLRTEPDR